MSTATITPVTIAYFGFVVLADGFGIGFRCVTGARIGRLRWVAIAVAAVVLDGRVFVRAGLFFGFIDLCVGRVGVGWQQERHVVLALREGRRTVVHVGDVDTHLGRQFRRKPGFTEIRNLYVEAEEGNLLVIEKHDRLDGTGTGIDVEVAPWKHIENVVV
uniref:Uncharacterized protein n=1 Tax=Anopheles darlingi TaxID=43151 RepID=A0A2M4DH83_ANODA